MFSFNKISTFVADMKKKDQTPKTREQIFAEKADNYGICYSTISIGVPSLFSTIFSGLISPTVRSAILMNYTLSATRQEAIGSTSLCAHQAARRHKETLASARTVARVTLFRRNNSPRRSCLLFLTRPQCVAAW